MRLVRRLSYNELFVNGFFVVEDVNIGTIEQF
jgi:hypothetical protein